MERPKPTRRYRRRTVRVEVDYDAPEGRRKDVATTLGAGGMFIATQSPLTEQTLFELRFRLRETGPQHAIEGRVVWSNRASDGVDHATCGMGVEFTDPALCAELALDLEDLD